MRSVHTLLALVERKAQKLQGKGYTTSIRQEIGAAIPHIPSAGAVVFDVGANVGEWSRGMLARAGNRISELHIFEPAPENADALNSLSDDPRVRLVQKAVAQESGTATLYSDAPGSGLASLTQRDLRSRSIVMDRKIQVETVSLDDYAEENAIRRIDILKLDIEGHELYALHGAQRLFAENRIGAVAFEFGGTHIDTRTYFRDFWNFFSDRNFDLARLSPLGLVPIKRYRETLEAPTMSNYLATHRGTRP